MTTTPNDAAMNAESAAKLVSKLTHWFKIDRTVDRKRTIKAAIDYIERHATPQTDSAAGVGVISKLRSFHAKVHLTDHITQLQPAYALALEGAAIAALAANMIERDGTAVSTAITDEMIDEGAEAIKEYHKTGSFGECPGIGWGEASACLEAALKARSETEPVTHATPQTQATHGEGEAVANTPRDYEYDQDCASCGRPEDDCKCRFQPAPSPTAAPALGELATRLKQRNPETIGRGVSHIAENAPALTEYERAVLRQAAAALSGVAAPPEAWECEHVAYGKYIDKQTVASCAASDPDAFKLYSCDKPPASGVAAQGDKPRFDEAQFAEMTRKGAEAWKDVPDVAAWINEQRGAQGGVPKGWTIAQQGDAILVRGPGGDAYLSDEKHNSPISVIILFRLAKALLAAKKDSEARVSEDAEFALYIDDSQEAGASGPRECAWREIMHYAVQYANDGKVRIEEVIRKPVAIVSIDQDGKAA